MANPGMRHAFKSAKSDPSDSTLVGATKWNDRHYFLEDDGSTAAGAVGDLPYRGTAGLVTLLTGAQGVLTSAGSGNVPAWTMSPSLTTLTLTRTALGTTPTVAETLTNTTAAAAGAQQISPSTDWVGQGWKTDATAASQEVRFRADVLPVQGTSAPTGTWRLGAQINGGAISYPWTVTSDGAASLSGTLTVGNGLVVTNNINIGATRLIEWGSSTRINAPANALFNLTDSNANFGVQLNMGTAAPTFNNGNVTAGSRNACGEVTLTGGNTAGTVTFGAPNWSNTPFVVLTEGQGTNTVIVTAVSTTAFSFTGATANGIVRWIALGRV